MGGIKSSIAIAAILALAGTGLYFLSAVYEGRVAELQQELARVRADRTAAATAAAAEAKSMAEKATAERLRAERALAEARAMAEKAAAERVRTEAEKAIADAKAAVERAKADTEKAKRAAASASVAPQSAESLFEQAWSLEQQGEGGAAVKAYVRAARSGSGKAAARLGEIYDKGLLGIARDYAESLKWLNFARVLGEDVQLGRSR